MTGVFTPTTRRNYRQLVANSCSHRRRRRDKTVSSVGIRGVYWALRTVSHLPPVPPQFWCFWLAVTKDMRLFPEVYFSGPGLTATASAMRSFRGPGNARFISISSHAATAERWPISRPKLFARGPCRHCCMPRHCCCRCAAATADTALCSVLINS